MTYGQKKKLKKRIIRILTVNIPLIILFLVIMFPIYWTVITSFKDCLLYTSGIFVDGKEYCRTKRGITGIYGLKPDRRYEIMAFSKTASASVEVKTDYEYVTLNVKDFGAKGDGVSDDTGFIQAAIMCCPKDSRVLVPEGVYRVSSLFLKDDIRLELAKEMCIRDRS